MFPQSCPGRDVKSQIMLKGRRGSPWAESVAEPTLGLGLGCHHRGARGTLGSFVLRPVTQAGWALRPLTLSLKGSPSGSGIWPTTGLSSQGLCECPSPGVFYGRFRSGLGEAGPFQQNPIFLPLKQLVLYSRNVPSWPTGFFLLPVLPYVTSKLLRHPSPQGSVGGDPVREKESGQPCLAGHQPR